MKLGDKLKAIEESSHTHLTSTDGIYARLDGKRFSRFTEGFETPYDKGFRSAMLDTTKSLLEITRADLAYTQSDEISLYWSPRTQLDFNGRYDKWLGELVGIATSTFSQCTHTLFPEKVKLLPRFDCRIFNVNDDEAFEFFLWRYLDCRKNSISMVAHEHYNHKELKHKSTMGRLSMIEEVGDNWESYPLSFRHGTFMRRVESMQPIDKSGIPDDIKEFVPDMAMRMMTESFTPPTLKDVSNLTQLMNFGKS